MSLATGHVLVTTHSQSITIMNLLDMKSFPLTVIGRDPQQERRFSLDL